MKLNGIGEEDLEDLPGEGEGRGRGGRGREREREGEGRWQNDDTSCALPHERNLSSESPLIYTCTCSYVCQSIRMCVHM